MVIVQFDLGLSLGTEPVILSGPARASSWRSFRVFVSLPLVCVCVVRVVCLQQFSSRTQAVDQAL